MDDHKGGEWKSLSLKTAVSCILVLAAISPSCWAVYALWTGSMTTEGLLVAAVWLMVFLGLGQALAPKLGWRIDSTPEKTESSYQVARRLTNKTHLTVYAVIVAAVVVMVVFGDAIRSYLDREGIVATKVLAVALAAISIIITSRILYDHYRRRS